MTGPRSILVALDGSPPASAALRTAIEIAKLAHSSLVLIAVSPLPTFYGPDPGPVEQAIASSLEYFRGVLDAAKKQAVSGGIAAPTTVLREGFVIDQLVTYIEENRPDLVVMGDRGLSRSERLFLGSVSEGVLHHSTRSVLIVRARPAASSAGAQAGAPATRGPTP